MAGARKIQQQWLLILRGYARAPGPQGTLQPVEIRALLDSGAEGDFMSPSLATKLGGQLEEGKFGFALGVFGEERPISKQARDLHIELRGAQAGSGLGQDFRTQHTVLVSPTELGTMYNMLLGAPFLEKHHAALGYGKRAGIELTAQDGTTTSFPVEARCDGEEEEQIESEDEEAEHWSAQERQEVARRKVHAIRRPLSGSRKRELRREQRWWIEEGQRMAKLARAQRPDLVMTTDELEACWSSSAPNAVNIFLCYNVWEWKMLVWNLQHAFHSEGLAGVEVEEDGLCCSNHDTTVPVGRRTSYPSHGTVLSNSARTAESYERLALG